MSDAMFNLMASGTARRVLAKSGLDMGSKQAAMFLQSKFMLLLYVVRTMCSKHREFQHMVCMMGILGVADRSFRVIMTTGKSQETETWTISKFMHSLQVQLKKDDREELKDHVKMDIDQEVMVGGQLVPIDKDGWPLLSEDMGMHDDPDESIMTKAIQDAAKPSIARAGDQKAALHLRQAGIDISDTQAALQAMRAEKKEPKRHACNKRDKRPQARHRPIDASWAWTKRRPRTRAPIARTWARARTTRTRRVRSCSTNPPSIGSLVHANMPMCQQ